MYTIFKGDQSTYIIAAEIILYIETELSSQVETEMSLCSVEQSNYTVTATGMKFQKPIGMHRSEVFSYLNDIINAILNQY